VNRVDPAGTIWSFLKPVLRALRIIRPSSASVPLPSSTLPSPLSVRGSIHRPDPRVRAVSQSSAGSNRSNSSDTLSDFIHSRFPGMDPSGNRRSASTASLASSTSNHPGAVSVDEHLHAMSFNRPFLGETPENAFDPPPSYSPPPSYRSLRPLQPGPPPPYEEVDRIRKP
jgi:hypothetical protein